MQGVQQALDQPVEARQIRLDGIPSGLVTEAEKAFDDGEERSGGSGHHEQQIE